MTTKNQRPGSLYDELKAKADEQGVAVVDVLRAAIGTTAVSRSNPQPPTTHDFVRVEALSPDGPWKLFVGNMGVAQWPSSAGSEVPEEYARQVARTLRSALAVGSKSPSAEIPASLLHELTKRWDVAYAAGHRDASSPETATPEVERYGWKLHHGVTVAECPGCHWRMAADQESRGDSNASAPGQPFYDCPTCGDSGAMYPTPAESARRESWGRERATKDERATGDAGQAGVVPNVSPASSRGGEGGDAERSTDRDDVVSPSAKLAGADGAREHQAVRPDLTRAGNASYTKGDRVRVIGGAWQSSIGKLATVEHVYPLADDGTGVIRIVVDGDPGTLSLAVFDVEPVEHDAGDTGGAK